MKIFLSLITLLFTSLLYATELKIASYNVENLFDMKYSGREYDAYIPNRHNWTLSNYKKKLLNISEVICGIDADIIALQEIENENVLKALQKSLKRVGCNYKYRAITHKKISAIQQAILSKKPIQSTRELKVGYKLGLRPILEAKFMIEGRALYIYVNHWKSKASKEPQRMVSAKVLKKRLLQLPKESEYILIGDFNSNYNEDELIGSSTGLNTTLNSVNENKIQQKIFAHYNLWLELPIYKRWSHNFYGDKQGLDAILLPHTLFDGRGVDYVNDSFYVFKKSYLFHKKGYIFRWVYKKNRHRGEGYSDHLPVVATFSTKPYRYLPSTVRLEKEVKVISKDKKRAWIKLKNREKILIYGGVKDLYVGKKYDISIYSEQIYKGEREIIDFKIEKRYDDKK